MFWKKKPSPIEIEIVEEIKRLQKSLETTNITADEYTLTLDAMERLTELRKAYLPEPVKKEALIGVLGNVLGIGTVVGTEVLGSRLLNRNGLSMIRKF